MAVFPFFLCVVFVLWRFAAQFISRKKPSSKKDKYIVLRGPARGEILEAESVDVASDRIALRMLGSSNNSQAGYERSDIHLISDEVADLLLAITCPAKRLQVMGDNERLANGTRIGTGSRVLVELGEVEDEIPGVVLCKGSVGRLGGTLFAVQLKEEDDIDRERPVLFKGRTYFRNKSDPCVLVSRDRRVLVPISNLRLQTGEARAARPLKTAREAVKSHGDFTASVISEKEEDFDLPPRTRLREQSDSIDYRSTFDDSPRRTRPGERELAEPVAAPSLQTSEARAARPLKSAGEAVKSRGDFTASAISEKEEDFDLPPTTRLREQSDSIDYRSTFDDSPRRTRPSERELAELTTAPSSQTSDARADRTLKSAGEEVKSRSPNLAPGVTVSDRQNERRQLVENTETRRQKCRSVKSRSPDPAPGVTVSDRQNERRQLRKTTETRQKRRSEPITMAISEKEEDFDLLLRTRRRQQSDSIDYRSTFDATPRRTRPRGRELAAAPSLDLSLLEGLPDDWVIESRTPLIPEPAVNRYDDAASDARPLLSEVPAAGRPLGLGERVVAFDSMERMLRGCVRYIANVKDKRGNITLGVELDEPQGSGTGMRNGVRHFTCPKDHALFVPIGAVLSEDDFEGRQPTTESDHPTGTKEVILGRSCAHSEKEEESTEVTIGLSSQQQRTADSSEVLMIKELRQICNTKDRQLEELRAELHGALGMQETLARALLEERENFERERNIQAKPQESATDWTVKRCEVNVTDRRLGKGAWATVSVGLFRGTEVAVKQIHDLILSDFNRDLFKREMQIASRCRHPCLLQFIGATTDDGPALLITELLDSNLRSVLNQRRLTEEQVITIALDISRGLNYLHLSDPSIIHRDVSSANVLLWRRDGCWRAKLSDYGTANFMRQCGTVSPGAPLYVAPEAQNVKLQSPKMDVYSFGTLLCEMCIRQLPSTSPQARHEQIDRVTNTALRSLVTQCVQTDTEMRPDMADVLTSLSSLTSSTGLWTGQGVGS